MLRLIANESHASDLASTASPNNALITPNPPPMPHNYPAHLASTREEIDNLVKMQAEQDRSVQNLTNLLQPLSPTGSIPGLGQDDMGTSIPPPLDLDQIFNSGDYFSDFTDLDKGGGLSGFGDVHAGQGNDHSGHCDGNTNEHVVAETHGNDLFDFDGLPSGPIQDMFGDAPNAIPNPPQQQQPVTGFFDGFENMNGSGRIDRTGHGDGSGGVGFSGGSGKGADGGRITETFTSSEATSPATTIVDENLQGMDAGNIAAPGGRPGRSPIVKRRKKNR
jgi:heat shock transcription factor